MIGERGTRTSFDAVVAEGWRAGRGPHGGYLAAILLRALEQSVAEPQRAARSLTIHYARAPLPGPVRITTVLEREGRSLSTLSARIEQEGRPVALALAAFSVPWSGPEISQIPLPSVPGPDADRVAGSKLNLDSPGFTRHLILQPRIGGAPFAVGATGSWVGWTGQNAQLIDPYTDEAPNPGARASTFGASCS